MGFLKKIFGRKGSKKGAFVTADGSSESNASSTKKKKLSRKERREQKNANKTGSFLVVGSKRPISVKSSKSSKSNKSNKNLQSQRERERRIDQINAMASGSRTGTDSYSPPQDRDGLHDGSKRPSSRNNQLSPQQQEHHNHHYDPSLDPMAMNINIHAPDSSPYPGPTGNPRASEEMVRKPAFHHQRNPNHHQVHTPTSAGSHSTNSSHHHMISPNNRHHERRSPQSYSDENGLDRRDYEDNHHGYDGYKEYNNNNDPRRHPNRQHQEEEEEAPDVGMVQFGGKNAFNNNNKRSNMGPYHEDDNDDNTNYSNSRLSPAEGSRDSTTKDKNNRTNNPMSPNDNYDHHQSHNHGEPSLQYDQVQQLEQLSNHAPDHPYHNSAIDKRALQLKRLPDGQLIRTDNHQSRNENLSPVSASSDFDLSTDAEDNEYNHIRRAANSNMKPMLQPHSPQSEESEGDYDREYQYQHQDIATNRSRHYFSDSDHDTMTSPTGGGGGGSLDMKPSKSRDSLTSPNEADNDEDDDDIAQSRKGSNEKKLEKGSKSRFTFDNEFEEALVKSKRKSSPISATDRPPSPTAFQKINKGNKRGVDDEKSQVTNKSLDSVMSPRTLAIRAAQNMRAQGKLSPEYSEYDTDSGKRNHNKHRDVKPPRTSRSQESNSSGGSSGVNIIRGKRQNDGVIENFADFETFANNEFNRTAKSVADPTSPVSELLAQARARRKHRKGASQSVNSEPALNASMLRQQLNIPHQSNSEAKKKLHQRRLEKEKFIKLLQEGKGGLDEDSDREKEKNESWLFDEVKETLGPRGVAADLESLGERSNRSKTSIGNKSLRSQKSHKSNKSYRSQKSSASHRRMKRSDESVGSRHSRSSRYSVRSTKSYVSQMSQESRSVANDLIRLEMQLAMVGSNLKKGENEVKKQLELDAQRKGLKDGISVGESSLGLKSYSSRKSRKNITIPKRTKTVVTAPPGKLGIILANRTDSRGTVVSGVRTTSVLANRISPGDRIVSIDGEDVSRMTVPEITAIMARKSDFERVLTVLKSPQR